jgi:hypothetical protein
LKIIEDLRSEASTSCSLLNSKAQLECQEHDQGETLWAAIDYGTMSESTNGISSVSSNEASLDRINMPLTDDYDPSICQRDSPIPAFPDSNDEVFYHNLTLDGMTPLATFFGSWPAVDTFGA